MKMKYFWKVFTVFITVILCGCIDQICNNFPPDNRQPDCESCRVMFIGSSYLNYAGNNVVEIFSNLCAAAEKDVILGSSVYGGYRLHHHIENNSTIDMVNSQGWDYVILQGNAAYISKKEWHANLIPYLSDFRKLIKYNYDRTSIIYMMPWAYLDGLTFIEGETDTYEDMQNNIYKNTISYVTSLDISIAPAGWAWYHTIKQGYDGSLYLNDLNHQTFDGAYLTACVFYSTLFLEKAPFIEEYANEIPKEDFLRDIAYEIVINDLDNWNIY